MYLFFLDIEPNLNSNLGGLQKISLHWGLKRNMSDFQVFLIRKRGEKKRKERSIRGRLVRKALQDYLSPQGWKKNGVGSGVLSKLDVFIH